MFACDIEQMPEWALLGVIRARRITCGGPDAAILFLNQFCVAQILCTTVAPFAAHALVQALGESLRQAIGDSLRHDRVVVVVLGPESIAQLLQADPAGHRECTDMIGQSGFLGRDKVGERPAWLAAFSV